MLNDRDDKQYENPEESEYHFSDEEVNYEVETESPKTVPASEQKESVLNRLTRSKRMLISLGVFLVLVFVVYKMVAPTSTPQATDITPPIVAQAQQKPMTQVTPQQAPAVLPVATTTTTTTTQAPPQAPIAQAQATPAQQPTSLPQMQVSQVALPVQIPQVETPAATPAQQSALTQQTTVTPLTQTTTTITPPSAVAGIGTILPPGTDSRVAVLASENQKLATQLQQEYAQKINDYASQNRALQDQVQTLNTRVASMETQMNQLIQALTRQNAQTQGQAAATQQAAQQGPDVKVPYNVQAIIPGRAWLRSDSGETLTVAEGDLVKDVGRVTKIDPYDGVVEINTGTKTVSLSYGNGS